MKNLLRCMTALLLSGTMLAAQASAFTTSDWAAREIADAYERGWVSPSFDLGEDYTRPISRAQFARLAIDAFAAAQGIDAATLAQQIGLIEPTADSGASEDASDERPNVDATASGESDATAPEDTSDERLDASGEPNADHEEAPQGITPQLPEAIPGFFPDTADPYVALAAKLSFISGDTGGLFRPGDTLARCEAAAILQRLLAALDRTEANTLPPSFADAYFLPRGSVESSQFVSGRQTPSGARVMSGADGKFDPFDYYTIEQAILSVSRAMDSVPDASTVEGWRTAPGYDAVSIAFTAGGDCTFGRGKDFSYKGSFDEKYDKIGDPAYFFSGIREFHDDDLTMVNFEGTLTTETRAQDKTFVFKGRPEYARILPAGSINAVTVANNHSKDYLQKGFEDTLRNLSPYIAVSGYEHMPILTVKGVRVGLASNGGWSFDAAQKRFITGAVKDLRERGADIVIFNFHWGIEGKYKSNATQQSIARFAIDNGADLIIGHHPHVVQEVETYKGKQIAYSLGNLVFGGNKNPRDKNCLIFRQNFTMNLDTRQITIGDHRAIPYRISSVNNANDYHPVPA